VGSATTAFQLSTTFPNNRILFGVGTGIPYSDVGFVYNNGFVGIGTANPACPLQVATGTGQFTLGVGILESTHAASRRASIGFGENTASWTVGQDSVGNGTRDFFIYGNSASRFNILSSGNVGIGSTSPGTKLDVVGDMRVAQGYTYIGGAGAQNAAFALNYIDTASSYKSLIFGRANSFSNAGEVNFNYVGPGSASNWLGLGFYANYPVAITAGGNMGIGITNPVSKLHAFTGVSGTVASFVSSGGAGSYSNVDISTYLNGSNVPTTRIAVIDESFSGHFTILTKTTGSENNVLNERMRIKNNGNVGIGTTDPLNFFSQATLTGMYGNSSNYSVLNVDSGGMSAGDVIHINKRYLGNYGIRMDTLGFPANYIFFAASNGGFNPGTITATNTTTMVYGSTSDYRIKSNVVPLANSIEFIDKLRPVNFTFNQNPTEVVAGFIAHEFQELIPHAVTGVKDDVDENGKMRIQNLDVSFVVPYLTAAMKDLVAKNTDLEGVVNSHAATIGSLNTQLQTAQNDIDLLESRLAAIEALISTNTSADTTTSSTGTRSDALLAAAGAV
jgi:hypothetical protein